MSGGTDHTLAIKTSGTLWAWGMNDYGQLGDDSDQSEVTPLQIGTESNWQQVSAGTYTSLALSTDGSLWSWGSNGDGQLGNETYDDQYTPIQVSGITNGVQAAAGTSFSVVLESGNQFCGTGLNNYGQLGDGTTDDETIFSCFTFTVEKPAVLSLNSNYNLLLKPDGTLWYWGWSYYGTTPTPSQVGTAGDWKQISVGTTYFLALKDDGTLWSSDTFNGLPSPVQIGATADWKEISAGMNYYLALKIDGTMWGGGNGQLPTQIGSATNWKQISLGPYYALALKTDGTLWMWILNYDYYDLYNDGIDRTLPVQVGTDTNWNQISAGTGQLLAIKTNGTMWGWGYNYYGQIGDGTSTNKQSPVQIGTATSWKQVSGGYDHSLAIKADGTLWAWGNNQDGQLGDGTQDEGVLEPTQVSGITNCIQVAAGWWYSLILKDDDQYCGVGRNSVGQLGDGTIDDKTTYNCFAFSSSYLKSAKVQSTTLESVQINLAKSSLLQNYPNPTHGATTIDYYLTDDATNAKIVLYNFTGGIVKEYPVHGIGKSSIDINIENLPSDIYSYRLVVNGAKVDVKKLLLVK